MKVFISWSGEKSKAVAELLREWLQCVLQQCEPWMSATDIDRGSIWFSEILQILSEVTIGIICLTNENKERPWMLFEAGAIVKGLSKNRVCTFLIDLEPKDIRPPLAQFNHTLPNKNDIFQLVLTINKHMDEGKLKTELLKKVFDKFWNDFNSKMEFINNEYNINDENPENEMISYYKQDEILEEVLYTVRGLERQIVKLEGPNYFFNNNSGAIYFAMPRKEKINAIVNFMRENSLDKEPIRDVIERVVEVYGPLSMDEVFEIDSKLKEDC